ncbi:hypothetical protein [Thermoleptolyngbya sp. M55_K2018_002]|uniref:hypothetical protein n=1 Tax=Thermoleptolyngbya sp. M55_K2018_002 TaxID=2747808 RepID=UPI0019E681ED|nr:hypothetical protein [Thermoleptolyngbya sp. M55_K2018_002]HIK42144.1 DUF3862 domain-containing protein [Thermoleptolyngbya sp. M55_K2018_002]
MLRFFLILAIALPIAACEVDFPAAQPSPSVSPAAVTKAEFDQVQPGMTLAEVEAILGKGEEISRSAIAGTETVMYQWTNADFSNANAMFQDGKLISKSQAQLK